MGTDGLAGLWETVSCAYGLSQWLVAFGHHLYSYIGLPQSLQKFAIIPIDIPTYPITFFSLADLMPTLH